MKKRLLITSIVMMLVVAVALSTATYAWFTSNTSVSASVMTLKAASSDASSLGIGWTGSAAQSAIVSPIYTTLEPMAPMDTDGTNVRALKNGTSTYEISDSNIQFYTSTVKELNSVISFNNAYTATGANKKPVVYTQDPTKATDDSASDVRSFYIKNLSKANTISSVTVSGLFPGSGEGETKYAIVTEAAPIQNKRYFTYSAGSYTEILSTDRTYLQTNGFLSNVTYYEIAYTFIQTKDTQMNKDTNYYKFTDVTSDANEVYAADKYYKLTDEGNYVVSGDATAPTNYFKKELIPWADGDIPTGQNDPKYYEELSGDDMIRVALYTKRYTLATGNGEASKTYYQYDASTGIMGTTGIEGSTLTGTVLTGKGYYYAEANHTLLGVLGKSATALKKTSSYDKNATYFTVTEVENSSTADASRVVNKWNFFNYFVADGSTGNYKKATSYDKTVTYYRATQVTDKVIKEGTAGSGEVLYSSTNHFIAENTVVNGQITVNGAVKDMNYYTDVVPSITFAEKLAPGEQVDIIAVVWLDGTMLDDTRAGELAQVSLLFNANDKVIGA